MRQRLAKRLSLIALGMVVASCSGSAVSGGVTDEVLRPTILTWVNSTGLVEGEVTVWRQRLTQACDQGVWDDDVARQLAERYVGEDQDVAMEGVSDGDELRARAAQALWIMAVQVCPDEFPPGEIEDGPPGV
ncbi:MAG TPA: hypothetical protein VIW46_08375 [Acidimicrobiia bacterium]|jgi:hypothetical protein